MAERSEREESAGAAAALSRGFVALVTALQQGFETGLAERSRVNEAGRSVTERGVEAIYAVLARPEVDSDDAPTRARSPEAA